MSTHLAEQFANRKPLCNTRLTELMGACRGDYREVTVTAVGCGDAFINRYWPELELLLNQERIKLTVVDQYPFEGLVDDKLSRASKASEKDKRELKNLEVLKSRYGALQQALRDRPRDVAYLNIGEPADCADYHRLTQDVVFVLVPDHIHVKYANDWLRRAILVVIEKPYNANLPQAQEFEKVLTEIARSGKGDHPCTSVVCIDHYFAKIFQCVVNQNAHVLQRKIGAVQRVEFSICESGGAEEWRVESLKAGMVYDLFCHVLAQVSPFVDLQTFLAEPPKILVAQHGGWEHPSETYFHVESENLRDLHGRRVVLSGDGGKGIGEEDVKFIRIVGEKGALVGDFGPRSGGKLLLGDDANCPPLFKINRGHQEILDAIFSGRFMEEPVGGLATEVALRILQILTSIKDRVALKVGNLPRHQYSLKTPVEAIREKAVQLD